MGDQDDAVAEEWHARAAGHQPFLELDVGDAAFVDPGVVRDSDSLCGGLPIFM